MESITEIPIERVVRGDNDRTEFNPAEIAELAESIAAHGLVQPITVRPFEGEDGKTSFCIVAGERRFRAHQHLGLPTIKAIVREDLDDDAASDIMLIENVNRVDLNPLDEARAYDKRAALLAGTEKERNAAIASKVGKSAEYIEGRRSLLTLVDEARFLIRSGQLPLGHALCLVKLDTNRQRMALRYYNRGGKMALGLFRELCNQLYEAQVAEAQQGMALFDMALWDRVAATQEIPLRGKKAVVAVPKRSDLPKPRQEAGSDNAAIVIERWIAELVAQGKTEEAATAGVLYEGLVHLNFLSVPLQGDMTREALRNG